MLSTAINYPSASERILKDLLLAKKIKEDDRWCTKSAVVGEALMLDFRRSASVCCQSQAFMKLTLLRRWWSQVQLEGTATRILWKSLQCEAVSLNSPHIMWEPLMRNSGSCLTSEMHKGRCSLSSVFYFRRQNMTLNFQPKPTFMCFYIQIATFIFQVFTTFSIY